jgi:hypothetical protein
MRDNISARFFLTLLIQNKIAISLPDILPRSMECCLNNISITFQLIFLSFLLFERRNLAPDMKIAAQRF